jgi:CheY-like chemotaxis protein
MSILLVDPDTHTRKFYAVNLRSPGRSTHEADTLHAAWHASLICRPSLIIMEPCGYTHGSGLEFLQRLADSPDTTHIPVLVITTQYEGLSAISEIKNVQQVLAKPISRYTLMTAVNTILEVPVSFNRLIVA